MLFETGKPHWLVYYLQIIILHLCKIYKFQGVFMSVFSFNPHSFLEVRKLRLCLHSAPLYSPGPFWSGQQLRQIPSFPVKPAAKMVVAGRG